VTLQLPALSLVTLLLSASLGHPIRALFHQLTRCVDTHGIGSARITNRPSFWRDEDALWNTGTVERIDPGTPQFEIYWAHYDPLHHVVLIAQIGNEYGDTVYAVTAMRYAFARADLSDSLPIRGLRLGETRDQVKRDFGSGYRYDMCGENQYFYELTMPYKGGSMLAAFILTFEHGRLSKFIQLSLER